MSRFTTLFAAVARPHLLHHHGEAVTRYPLGVEGSAVSVTGIFSEGNPDHNFTDGETIARRGTFRVSSSVTVDKRDSWLIRSEKWQAATVRSAAAGMIVIELERTDRILTHGNQGITQL